MTLQKLVLPDLLIREMYKDVHIINDQISDSLPDKLLDPNQQVLKFLGNNLKKITMVVQHPENVYLPERHLEFLTKILGACKLNIGDVAIVNAASQNVDNNILISNLQPKLVILFGVDPANIKLPLSFPQFKLQDFANCTYLYVPSLDGLNIESEEAKLLKTKLWVCLKTIFDVSI
jgi:hypothetical protein